MLQSMESQRVRHDLATEQQQQQWGKAQGSRNRIKSEIPPEDYVLQEFAKTIRNALVKGVPTSLSSVVACFCRSGLRVGEGCYRTKITDRNGNVPETIEAR